MLKFLAGLTACFVVLCAGYAVASRNSSGTMAAINGPFTSGTTISSSAVNARLSDIETELTDSLSRSGKGGMTAPLRVANGLASAPSFSFTNDTGSGLYRVGSNDLGWAINGVKKLELTSALFTITPAVAFSALPTVTITSASGATASASSSMVLDSSASHFLSLLGPNAGHTGIIFGDVAGGSRGYIQYNNSADSPADTMAFGVGGSTRASITSAGIAASSGLTIGATGTAITARYRGTTSWTPGSVAASTATTKAITVTGAAAGADCSVTPPSATGAFTIQCVVTADTCTVTIYNTLASGPSNGSSGTWSCVVENP